jgi:hypothetical protein
MLAGEIGLGGDIIQMKKEAIFLMIRQFAETNKVPNKERIEYT